MQRGYKRGWAAASPLARGLETQVPNCPTRIRRTCGPWRLARWPTPTAIPPSRTPARIQRRRVTFASGSSALILQPRHRQNTPPSQHNWASQRVLTTADHEGNRQLRRPPDIAKHSGGRSRGWSACRWSGPRRWLPSGVPGLQSGRTQPYSVPGAPPERRCALTHATASLCARSSDAPTRSSPEYTLSAPIKSVMPVTRSCS